MRILSPVSLAATALLLAGCGASPFGIWLFEIPSATDDDEDCTDSVSHNFTGAEAVEEDSGGDYTSEITTERSGSLVLARIEATGEGQALMIIDNDVYPGTETRDGVWSFSWTGSQITDQADEHTQGYSYTWSGSSEMTENFVLTFGAQAVNGTYTVNTYDHDAYTETDSWSQQVAKYIGAEGLIPASRHLTVSGPTGDMPASNRYDDSDCDSAPCELAVASDCSVDLDFSGTLTAFTEDEAYDAVGGAGQNPGL